MQALVMLLKPTAEDPYSQLEGDRKPTYRNRKEWNGESDQRMETAHIGNPAEQGMGILASYSQPGVNANILTHSLLSYII